MRSSVYYGTKGQRNLALLVKGVAILLAGWFVYLTDYAYALFALPVFVLDFCVAEPYREDIVVSTFKAFLLCQGVALWYLNSIHFFDVPANNMMQNALKFHEQFDWQNTSAVMQGMERAMHSLSTGAIHAAESVLPLAVGAPAVLFPVQVLSTASGHTCNLSRDLLNQTFGALPSTNFPDLRYYTKGEILTRYPTIFKELPRNGFDGQYKNPCWRVADRGDRLACLPYAYILGQPKSGTSDLFERLKSHSDVVMPTRKEVRWFTRGEFSRAVLPYEGTGAGPAGSAGSAGGGAGILEGLTRGERLLGTASSVFTFTRFFRDLAFQLEEEGDIDAVAQSLITVDGGPHTLWWPTQSPDGQFVLDIPIPQLLREMQPDAKFIITLNDPVRRMFSDYYFLHDNLKPLRPGMPHEKSGEEFHRRVELQVQQFRQCVAGYEALLLTQQDQPPQPQQHGAARREKGEPAAVGDPDFPAWFRASQMCAHDRHRFGVAGWGRLSISLYVLFLEKWLEHFAPDQFLVVRLEDYEADPRGYMGAAFRFLGLKEPKDWTDVLRNVHFNSHKVPRDPILPQTEALLRDFFRPYNALLARTLGDDKFLWQVGESEHPVHAALVAENDRSAPRPGALWSEGPEGDEGMGLQRSRHPHGPLKGGDRAHHPSLREGGSMRDPMGEEGHEAGYLRDAERLRAEDLAERERFTHRKWDQARRPNPWPDADDRTSEGRAPAPAAAGGRQDQRGSYLRKRPHAEDHGGLGALESGQEVPVNPPPPPPVEMVLKPHSFDTAGLPTPEEPLTADEALELNMDLSSRESAAAHLCGAAFTLDLSLLQYLLYEAGVPPDVTSSAEAGRTALHCLPLLFTLADASSKSHVFALLKGKASWLNKHFHPPMEVKQASVLSCDITSRLDRAMLRIARWLLAAGASVDAQDVSGATALQFAAMGGELGLARLLLDAGADPNAQNRDRRTPLHYAVALGHAELVALLMDRGGNPHLEDRHKMRPMDVISNPGPIGAADALRYLNVTQRPAKQIERVIHPELYPEDGRRGWVGGTGGWSTDRLAGYETNMSCPGVDQYWADEVTADLIFEKHMARNAPVMIRGLLADWKTVETYKQDALLRDHGDLKVQVSDIPYSDKFGSDRHVDKTLGEYIEEVKQHRMVGGKHPWYVFKGNVIPRTSEAKDSLVRIQDCPTPSVIQEAFERVVSMSMRGKGGGAEARKIFVNAQWALGGVGTGAPVHYHNTAWSSLIYGAKLWLLYPPHDMIMSNKQTLEYTETDMAEFERRGIRPLTCVQTAGDVMIVPESWGHAVLNIQESVTMATEAKTPMFRLSPGTKLMSKFSAAPPKPRKPLVGAA